MIDIGVASPSAHGQAMISTATALTSAYARRGSGPHERPDERRSSTATSDHGRHEPAGRRTSASRWIGARLRCASRDHAHDLREQRVGADALGAHHEQAPVPLTVPPMTAVARLLLDRDRLAGDHRLVDRARALEDHAVDRHLLAGPHAQPVADLHVVERHVLLGAVRPRRAAPSSGARPSSARIAPPVAAARPQLQHLAEQDQRRRSPPPPRSRRGHAAVAPAATRERAAARASRRRCSANAAPMPSAISVNMLRLRVTTDSQPRSKNGQPPQSTTGVASASCEPEPRARGRATARAAGPAASRAIASTNSGTVSARPTQNRRRHVGQLGVRAVVARSRARLQRHAADRAGCPARPGGPPGASGRCRCARRRPRRPRSSRPLGGCEIARGIRLELLRGSRGLQNQYVVPACSALPFFFFFFSHRSRLARALRRSP